MSARTLDEILRSTSEFLFPAEDGEAPVTLQARDAQGDTALHVVLWQRDFESALVLLDAGADPNAIGDMGETPFHVAAKAAPRCILERFIAAAGDSKILSEFGNTPQDIAVARDPSLSSLFQP